MKKILALLLVLALSLTLVACGSGNEGRSFHWQLQGRHGYRLR